MITRPAPIGPARGYHVGSTVGAVCAIAAEVDNITTANAERNVLSLLTGLFS
jgi:hypothetical protein